MQSKTKWLLVMGISAVIWISGVWYFYQSYNTPVMGEPSVGSPYRPVLGKEGYIDPETGRFVEKNFVEAKAGELFILTLLCGGTAVFALIKLVRNSNRKEDSQATDGSSSA